MVLTKRLIKSVLEKFDLAIMRHYPFLRRLYKYKPPKKVFTYLNSKYLARTFLVQPDDNGCDGDLYSIWKKIPKGSRWQHYFETYESVVGNFGDRPIRMLEIGVSNGSSIRMWKTYLHPESVYVGVDIEPKCKKFERVEENIFVRIGDQSNPDFLQELINEFGSFDIILDDGSHQCAHMIATFNYLFLDGLASPGIYLVEDAHSNYWIRYRQQSYSFIDFSKDLVDVMHWHYFGNEGVNLFLKNHPSRLLSVSVPKITAEIDQILFKDSMILFYKKSKKFLPVAVTTSGCKS